MGGHRHLRVHAGKPREEETSGQFCDTSRHCPQRKRTIWTKKKKKKPKFKFRGTRHIPGEVTVLPQPRGNPRGHKRLPEGASRSPGQQEMQPRPLCPEPAAARPSGLQALGGAPFPPRPPHPTPDSGPSRCALGAGAADRKPVERTALLYLEVPEPPARPGQRAAPAVTRCP